MFTRADIINRIKEIILNNLDEKITPDAITGDINIFHEFRIESVQVINIISDIEMLFSIRLELDDTTIESLKKIDTLADTVSEQIAIRNRAG